MAKKFDTSQSQLWTILNAQQNKKQQTNSPSKEVKKFDMSEAQLWAILNAQQNKKQQTNSPSDEKRDSFIEFFNTHLFEHLKKEHDPNGNANQPSKIIKDAQSSIGALSRIFDEYDCPTPNYEEINTIYQKPNGLREHIQENLKGIIPVLLNEDRTALHPDVIEAIGPENYKAILKNAQGDERAIAQQFVQAVILGYGQRIYQNTDDQNLKDNLYNTVLPALGKLAEKVTLQGLPEQSRELVPADILDTLIMSRGLLKLLNEANTAGVEIPNCRSMKDKLGTVFDVMDPKNEDYNMLPEATKICKARENYDEAINSFITGVRDILKKDEIPKPKEVSWFKKFLRFITSNEKLLQNADEKRYDQQFKVLSKIEDLNKKLNSLSQEKNISSEHEHTHEHGNGNRMTF
ncbi:TPA: hypothetical protein JBA76_15925, partial [Legionella pneumophila subsp. pneumophila]|uniref:hypothetical protein n=1 Tax=Legionella pneumophila TaxID=446 RepID=UPI000770A43E|nr:hypothetical protein [Legionella pneumophila]HAT8850777.1 hypothetical protein [Legionella pneumophila subsp. pneumophila]CZI82864.1 Uncharacterised protein [Legionella pneumophila]CZI85341.1 Uncharacterised protein [Legionella pneumophila]HAT1881379.1 hypothetical protein [Legionella pneumophila]HAT9170712.1 hypothetical protein [Legionella pneumophila subsp. pneumophila]